MPELPEVETISKGLHRDLRGKTITGLWTDWPKYFKLPKSEAAFKKMIVGKRITAVGRRAKNILIHLEEPKSKNPYILLIHQKMSGHLMIGKWKKVKSKKDYQKLPEAWVGQKWIPSSQNKLLKDPKNRFIRLIFFLDNSEMLALSDLRRFAKTLAGKADDVTNLPEIKNLGPEPLQKSFTYNIFKKILDKKKGLVKQVLLDPFVVSGIGNIYADEILWTSKIHPQRRIEVLTEKERKILYKNIVSVLSLAVRLRGTSIDDYRDHEGKVGGYQKIRKVYQREGEACLRCKARIRRLKIGNRSAHFCLGCQKI